MALRCTQTLLLLISVILVGYASRPQRTCNYYTNTECVKPKNCLSRNRRMQSLSGCPRNKVCCEPSFVHDDSPLSTPVDCGPNDVCLQPDMCDDPNQRFRSASVQIVCRKNH